MHATAARPSATVHFLELTANLHILYDLKPFETPPVTKLCVSPTQ
jgi:hypothetical protein